MVGMSSLHRILVAERVLFPYLQTGFIPVLSHSPALILFFLKIIYAPVCMLKRGALESTREPCKSLWFRLFMSRMSVTVAMVYGTAASCHRLEGNGPGPLRASCTPSPGHELLRYVVLFLICTDGRHVSQRAEPVVSRLVPPSVDHDPLHCILCCHSPGLHIVWMVLHGRVLCPRRKRGRSDIHFSLVFTSLQYRLNRNWKDP